MVEANSVARLKSYPVDHSSGKIIKLESNRLASTTQSVILARLEAGSPRTISIWAKETVNFIELILL